MNFLERLRMPQTLAVWLVFALFIGALALFLVVLMPLLWQQLSTLFRSCRACSANGSRCFCCCPSATRTW